MWMIPKSEMNFNEVEENDTKNGDKTVSLVQKHLRGTNKIVAMYLKRILW